MPRQYVKVLKDYYKNELVYKCFKKAARNERLFYLDRFVFSGGSGARCPSPDNSALSRNFR